MSHLIPLVLIVVTVETEQLPVASIGWIVVVVMILMMDSKLAQFLAVKFASAMRTDPGKQFDRALPISLLQLSLGVSCHASLGEGINSVLNDSTLAVGDDPGYPQYFMHAFFQYYTKYEHQRVHYSSSKSISKDTGESRQGETTTDP